jgi:hypothetical protein
MNKRKKIILVALCILCILAGWIMGRQIAIETTGVGTITIEEK